ncbi:MAG: hypothetical protein U0575_05460 [Phycisphaerales bacterium]
MSVVFVDTSFLVAFLNPSDALHGLAVDTFADLRATRLVTTDMVIGELLGFFSRSPRRRSIAVFARTLPTVSYGLQSILARPARLWCSRLGCRAGQRPAPQRARIN